MSYAINLTFRLLVWLVPGEKFYGLGTGFQFQTIPVPLYVLNPMGLLCIPECNQFHLREWTLNSSVDSPNWLPPPELDLHLFPGISPQGDMHV